MGLYGSKDQHPKLVGTPEENERLASLEWWYCEKCGHKHLKQYKKCPSCNQAHGGKSGWYRFWKALSIIQLPLTALCIWAICVAAGEVSTSGNYDNEQTPTSTRATAQMQLSKESTEQLREKYCAACETIDYMTLARNPDKYKGNYYKMTGEVIQVMEISGGVYVRMDVTQDEYGYWTDTIAATIQIPEGGDRILEDDIITIYGKCYGLYTYETVLGSEMSIPRIDVKYYDLLSE